MATNPNPRLRELDGLRAVSVLLVVIGHCVRHLFTPDSLNYKIWTNAGSTGVLIFFVISGYIITKLFIEERKIKGNISISNFYLRRMFRIIPAFYSYLIGIYILSFFGFVYVNKEEILISGAFLANLPFAHLGWFVVHSWSLATEEQFYLFFPFAFLVGLSFLGRKAFIFFWIFLYLVWGVLSAMHKEGMAGPFFHLTWIMSGVLISVYENKLKHVVIKCHSVFLIALVGLLFFWSAVSFNFPHQGIFYIPFSCFVICLLLMKSIYSSGFWAKFLLNPIIQWIGLCSYSIYLWQELFTRQPSFIWTPLGILSCAAFSYYFIEKPLNRAGRRFVSMRKPVTILIEEDVVPA